MLASALPRWLTVASARAPAEQTRRNGGWDTEMERLRKSNNSKQKVADAEEAAVDGRRLVRLAKQCLAMI